MSERTERIKAEIKEIADADAAERQRSGRSDVPVGTSGNPSTDILTLANVITFCRLGLTCAFLVLFAGGVNLSPAFAARFGEESLDFLVSNPPYIPTGELPTLQEEVRREPALALDGGGDGLVFYRAILQLWLSKVKPGGVLAVEIGEDQGQAVAGLFQAAGLEHVAVKKDLAALDRAVTGRVRGRTGQGKPLSVRFAHSPVFSGGGCLTQS